MKKETRYYFARDGYDERRMEFLRWASEREYDAFSEQLERGIQSRNLDPIHDVEPLDFMDGAAWGFDGIVSCHKTESPILPSPQGPVSANIEAYAIVTSMRETSPMAARELFPVDIEGSRVVQLIPHREEHGIWRIALEGVRDGEWHHLGWHGPALARIPLDIMLRKQTIAYLRDIKCPRVPGGVDTLSGGAAHWALDWILPKEIRRWSGAAIDAVEFKAWVDKNFDSEKQLAEILRAGNSTINRWGKEGVPKGPGAYAVRSLMGKRISRGMGREGRELAQFYEAFGHELSVTE